MVQLLESNALDSRSKPRKTVASPRVQWAFLSNALEFGRQSQTPVQYP